MDSEVCEFSFADEKVNSIRYNMMHEGQCYAIYVPKEVFAAIRHDPWCTCESVPHLISWTRLAKCREW